MKANFSAPIGVRALSRLPCEPSFCLSGPWRGLSGRLPARGVERRHAGRQLQLARADLDAGERDADSRASAVLSVLR